MSGGLGSMRVLEEKAKKYIPADVRLLAGCRDEQTSADLKDATKYYSNKKKKSSSSSSAFSFSSWLGGGGRLPGLVGELVVADEGDLALHLAHAAGHRVLEHGHAADHLAVVRAIALNGGQG